MSITLDELHYEDEEENLVEPSKTPPTGEEEEEDGNPRNGKNPEEEESPLDPPGKKPEEEEEEEEDDVVTPGIEQYLSEFNIEGGMITIDTEEGEVEKHFNDLSDEEQFNVLKSLAEQGYKQKTGLNEEETGLINYVRSKEGQSIEDIIEDLAIARFNEISAMKESTGVNYDEMSPDAIYTKWIKEANPEATEEDIAADLASAKESKLYEAKVDRIKDEFIKEQRDEVARQEYDRRIEAEQEIEEDRKLIVNSVSNIDNILGFPMDDNIKNEVLGKLLEVGESGDSLFMEEVFSDPAVLFKAAVLHYKGEEFIDSMEKYYKKEITNSRNRGRAEVAEGMPGAPNISGRKPKQKEDNPPIVPRTSNRISLEELHDED